MNLFDYLALIEMVLFCLAFSAMMNSMVYLAFMIIAGMFIIMAFAAYAALATKKRR
jgi:hypothetical protein